MHFVWLDALIMLITDSISTFLINPNIILYHAFSLNILEYR